MSNTTPVDDQEPLERAIHRLREAQTLHDTEEYDRVRENTANEMVDDALDDVSDYLDFQKGRMLQNVLVDDE